jgi:hypothetical protein
VEWCAPMLAAPGRTGRKEGMKDPGGREIIPPGSFILLKGGDLAAELATLGETVGRASVTVRSLEVEGSGDILMEKKVIIITP